VLTENIKQKYLSYDNPYRKTFFDNESLIACDFSDMIPYWYLEYYDYSENLLKIACEWAESRNYFGFYSIIDSKKLSPHIGFIETVDDRYENIIEEVIPANYKSRNILYWEWICDSTSENTERAIVLSILPQKYR
jgi:hypothetical protein